MTTIRSSNPSATGAVAPFGSGVKEAGNFFKHLFQNGGDDYLVEALHGQNFSKGYDWESSVPQTPFEDLETEQQARLLEDAEKAGWFDGNPFMHPVTKVDLDASMKHALEVIRAGRA